MVEVTSEDIVRLLNQTMTGQQEQAAAFQQSQETYFLYIIVSVVMSSLIYLFIFAKPIMTAMAWNVQARRLLKNYSEKTGRGVILMTHAQTGLFGSMITMQDALKIERLLRRFKSVNMPVDLIINTFGGDLFASLRIAHMLRQDPSIRVLVPKYAWSGGSLISIAAGKLLANKSSIFGAVDPQLGNLIWAFSAKDWQHIVDTKQKELDKGATTGAKDDTIAMAQMSKRLMKEMEGYVGELIQSKPSIDKTKFFDLFLHGDHSHANILSPDDLKSCGMEVELLDTDIPDRVIEKMYKQSGVFGYGKGIGAVHDQ